MQAVYNAAHARRKQEIKCLQTGAEVDTQSNGRTHDAVLAASPGPARRAARQAAARRRCQYVRHTGRQRGGCWAVRTASSLFERTHTNGPRQ